jgi:UMF1 family MFS transporter
MTTPALCRGVLQRFGLHRPELRAWALYDWANSAVVTTIIAAVFPIYFQRVAGANLPDEVATKRFGIATIIAMLGLALLAPVLGGFADRRPIKKRLLGLFLAIGAAAVFAMFFIRTGDWLLALALFIVVELAVSMTFVFYDALLPHIARGEEIDRVSTTSYALGYLGGGLLLTLNLAWIRFPQWWGLQAGNFPEVDATLPTRLAFLSVGLWWVIFSIPFFLKVPEPRVAPNTLIATSKPSRGAFDQFVEMAAALRKFKQAAFMLLAFLIYNEGIGTIIKMAAIYGAEIGLSASAMIGAILIVQFIGIPCTLLFGALAERIGAKRSIFAGLGVYLAIAFLAYIMRTNAQFVMLALLVGLVQGGTQGLSRSLFASLIPKEKAGQFFALFAMSEKLAGVLGPGLFVATLSITGSSRHAIASVVIFFLVGGLLLLRVDVDQGRLDASASLHRGKLDEEVTGQ